MSNYTVLQLLLHSSQRLAELNKKAQSYSIASHLFKLIFYRTANMGFTTTLIFVQMATSSQGLTIKEIIKGDIVKSSRYQYHL